MRIKTEVPELDRAIVRGKIADYALGVGTNEGIYGEELIKVLEEIIGLIKKKINSEAE